MAVTDEQIRNVADRLTRVPGVVGVTLGGSRARGDSVPESDVDLGLYYRLALDVAAVGDLVGRGDTTYVAGCLFRVVGAGWSPKRARWPPRHGCPERRRASPPARTASWR